VIFPLAAAVFGDAPWAFLDEKTVQPRRVAEDGGG
jgi:hypothetical protein